MKKLLLLALLATPLAQAETVTLNGTDYQVNRLIDRQIAPGVQYTRFRLPAYPLNINVVKVDLTNPYNRIETTVANESAKGTESLVSAANRQSYEAHRAVAGANANFWVVATQAEYPAYSGTTRNVSLRNGKLVTESNQFNDRWDGGTMRTGIVGVSADKKVYIDKCTSRIIVVNEKIDTLDVYQSNKGVKPNELCMYNSFYGASRAFMPISDTWVQEDLQDATEVLLDLNEGSSWSGGNDIAFTVAEVRTNAGTGTLGNHDLALVGRGEFRDKMAALAPGDGLIMKYDWTFRPNSDTKRVTPLLENAVGGNAMIMIDGELTTYNTNEAYNSQVYSRTGYGRSADRDTLYICVIDKSTDPVYGTSAGCPTSVMCEFMRTLGCTDMSNFDAGGSAEMLINGRIINKTTESSPRAVANGMLIYSIAPEDDNSVASLAFDEISLQAPIYGQFCPKVIAYNKYGFPVEYNFRDFTLTCSEGLGTCDGTTFTASGTPMTGTITATYGEVSVSAQLTVLQAEIGMRIKHLLLDGSRQYPLEVQATIGQQAYSYDPASVEWSVDDATVCEISAEGVIHGLSNGTTTITGRIGDYSDTAEVTVEIPEAETAELTDWTGWSVKGASGMNNAALTDAGTITFDYASPRDAYVQISKDITVYSLPESLTLSFNSSIPVASISLDVRTAANDRANVVKLTNGTEDTFPANEDVTVNLPIGDFCDAADLINYPIELKYVRFTCNRSSDYRGSQSIAVKSLAANYDIATDGVQGTIAAPTAGATISRNPLRPGESFSVAMDGLTEVEIIAASGATVSRVKADGTATLTAPAQPGLYIVSAKKGNKSTNSKIIVK